MTEVALGSVHSKTGFTLTGSHLLVFLDLFLLKSHLLTEFRINILLAQDHVGFEHVGAEVAPHGLFDHALLVILFDEAGDPALPEEMRGNPFFDTCLLCGPADDLGECAVFH